MVYFPSAKWFVALVAAALGVACSGILTQLSSNEQDPSKRNTYSGANWIVVAVTFCAIVYAIDKVHQLLTEADEDINNLNSQIISLERKQGIKLPTKMPDGQIVWK